MNIDNNSLYVQDHWTINSRWSADLGARFEHVKAVSTPAASSASTPTASCRGSPSPGTCAATASQIVHVTYGQYSGRYNEAQIGGEQPGRQPARHQLHV